MSFQFPVSSFQKITKNTLIISLLAASNWLLATPVLAEEKGQDLGTLKGLGAYEPNVEAGIGASGTMFSHILSNVITFLTIIGALMFAIYFIIGALSWVSAGGKAEQVEKAKNRMTNAAIGLIVVVAAYSVIYIVGKVLGISILEPGTYLPKLGPQSGSYIPTGTFRD